MEKENKKATASEKLTKVVAIRISQTDYDIFLEKAKMENPESTKINISKYLCSVLHDSTISKKQKSVISEETRVPLHRKYITG